MELKIGVIHTAREIELEIDPDAGVAEETEKALGEGSTLIWFADRKGRRVAVVADKLAYLEFGPEDSPRVVGFGS